MDRLITPNEAAQILRLSPTQVRNYLRSGKLEGIRHGINWMIRESDVRAFDPLGAVHLRRGDFDNVGEAEQQQDELGVGGFARADLEEFGFTGFVRVSYLRKRGYSSIPARMGVYLVVRESMKPPLFLQRSVGGCFHGKDPTVPIDSLRQNWVDGAYVVYIGKAGSLGSVATLRSRLSMYIRFGMGIPAAHYGGRLIWQLAECDELVLAWKPLSAEDPRKVEQGLIQEFQRAYGKMPFANLAK